MSKDTFVEAPVQGGAAGGGGGIPGIWTLEAFGVEVIGNNQNVVVTTKPEISAPSVYMMIASIAASANGLASIHEGNINAAPASTSIVYGEKEDAPGLIRFVIRAGSNVGIGNVINWAVYAVTN